MYKGKKKRVPLRAKSWEDRATWVEAPRAMTKMFS
jgi:hypothetical protein